MHDIETHDNVFASVSEQNSKYVACYFPLYLRSCNCPTRKSLLDGGSAACCQYIQAPSWGKVPLGQLVFVVEMANKTWSIFLWRTPEWRMMQWKSCMSKEADDCTIQHIDWFHVEIRWRINFWRSFECYSISILFYLLMLYDWTGRFLRSNHIIMMIVGKWCQYTSSIRDPFYCYTISAIHCQSDATPEADRILRHFSTRCEAP